MTREEELIGMLKILKEQARKSCKDTAILDVKIDSFIFVIDEAIKALDKEPILDKIRAEIAEHADRLSDSLYGDGLRHSLDIINKYREGSEGE